MELIARWNQRQHSCMELPDSVIWADGTPASIDDYKRHQLDTHTLQFDGFGRGVQHMFPDIVATASYDALVKDWVVKGQDVVTAALGLPDPNTKGEEILSELFTFPIVYRATIVRT